MFLSKKKSNLQVCNEIKTGIRISIFDLITKLELKFVSYRSFFFSQL